TGTASYNVSGTTANVTVPSYDDLGLANGMYDYTVTAVYEQVNRELQPLLPRPLKWLMLLILLKQMCNQILIMV
ncbi:MAG: hypothetical protein P9L91_01650, partial [Candidatus Zophobacter franzmannii]|nr:hypothetical protein [Candidatus Zophobacter franzmannii]